MKGFSHFVTVNRRPFHAETHPDHLPRERVVIDPPKSCECCGGNRMRKLGEDVTQTLETTPRRWKVVETVRERFSCRDCVTISQTPASFHVRKQAARLSRGHDLAKAIQYMLKRWPAFTLFLETGASACPTTRPSAGYAGSRSGGNHGYSAGLTAEAAAPQICTASSSRQR